MKRLTKIFVSALCVATLAVPVLITGCGNEPGGEGSDELVDYVSQLSLDFSSETKKQEVTVRLYVDGDTTHFDPVTNSTLTSYNAADFSKTQGYIKARYIAINTPESTGSIEEWGGKAADFTEEKLKNAQTIIVESDNNKWNLDSTGERYTVWVWYLPKGETKYRNLNLEILQEGLAFGSSTANNRYGEIASNALSQARESKLYVFSGEKDPDYFYGAAILLTLKELRCHIASYVDKRVKVEGVITSEFDNSVYIEDFDREAGVNFGMAVYYGFKTGKIRDVLSVGNRVSVVGVVTEYNGTYQISDVSYNAYDPAAATNSVIISENNEASYVETSARNIASGKLYVNFEKENEAGEIEIEKVELPYGEAIVGTTVTVKELTVTRAYTTNNDGKNDGAMSLTCSSQDGATITVRTTVWTDENGDKITQDKYEGKKINVKGIIEYYNGNYQVKCYRSDLIEILD